MGAPSVHPGRAACPLQLLLGWPVVEAGLTLVPLPATRPGVWAGASPEAALTAPWQSWLAIATASSFLPKATACPHHGCRLLAATMHHRDGVTQVTGASLLPSQPTAVARAEQGP